MNVSLIGSGEEMISMEVKGREYIKIDVEDLEIAILNESYVFFFGEYILNKEAFSTIQLSMTLEDQRWMVFLKATKYLFQKC